jgi:hypothetical protein
MSTEGRVRELGTGELLLLLLILLLLLPGPYP